MNGVRKLLAGASNAVASAPASRQQSPPPTPAPPHAPSPIQTSPLVIQGKPSWRPQSPPVTSPVATPLQNFRPFSPTGPSGTTTAGAFRKPPARGGESPQNYVPPSTTASIQTSPERSTINSRPSSNVSSVRKPLTASTSPTSPSGSIRSRRTVDTTIPPPPPLNWNNVPAVLNTRDELLMSLLTSEAVVDSRAFQIMSSEDVEELKKEYQVLSSRLVALRKKLQTETKIRDAATNLDRLNAPNRRMSKPTHEQLEAANRKVDAAQTDLWRVSERANEVYRRLMEHRAGILAFSVRNLENQLKQPGGDGDSDGFSTPSRNALSPTSTGNSSMGQRSKFEGPHLFAGHADAITPSFPRQAPSIAETTQLKEKLRAANEEAEAAKKKQAAFAREISMLKLEKTEVETSMALELQSAEETIVQLENEVSHVRDLEDQIRGLLKAQEKWERDRKSLQAEIDFRGRQAQDIEARLNALQERSQKADGTEQVLARVREEARQEIERKDREIAELQTTLELEREGWERERQNLEDEKMEDLAKLQQELDEARENDLTTARAIEEDMDAAMLSLQTIVRSHRVVTSPRNSTIPSLANAIGAHLSNIDAELDSQRRAKEDWDAARRKLEDDIRSGFESRERLGRELEEARRDREDARREIRSLEDRVKEQSDRFAELAASRAPITPSPTIAPSDAQEEYERIISLIRPLWAVLPSVEARASKVGSKANGLATGSPTGRGASESSASLSDLDVRALKTLYDPRTGFASSPAVQGEFTIDSFVSRVQALLADDRALIERLIRFAQSHELLKNNATRAQKLVQESNISLETYQKQVETLKERNTTLIGRQTSLLDEIAQLQEAVDRAIIEKRDLEEQAAEQAETCRNLTEANATLSQRALALAEEAASAPEAMRLKMEGQLAELQAKLKSTESEIDEMRNSEQMQRIQILDELNEMQKQNDILREQLRAEQRKNGK